MATGQFQIAYMANIKFLLDSTALDSVFLEGNIQFLKPLT